ncbi:hypothetical protein WN943_014181 [Citrus x changshan-huyou]
MVEGTKIFDHLGVLNGIVSELEAIGVKIEDEDKALRLLWSLSTFYKHMLPTLMYGKEMVDLEEVTSTLLSEERRLSGESTETTDISALAVVRNWKKNNSKKNGVYWGCGQLGHLKRDCHSRNGAGSPSDSRSDTDSINSGKSLIIVGDDDPLVCDGIYVDGCELSGKPTWKLHHKFQQDISTCADNCNETRSSWMIDIAGVCKCLERNANNQTSRVLDQAQQFMILSIIGTALHGAITKTRCASTTTHARLGFLWTSR